jgi:hypothetical protein
MKTDRKFFKTILGISLFIVIGGFVASFIVSAKVDSRERKTLEIRADNASLVFTSEEIRNLKGNEEDLNNGYYFDIKNKLLALRRANPDARFVYLMGANGEKLFFFADSESITSEDYSPPGQTYDETTPNDLERYFKGESYSEGPYSDRWGKWVSGYSHIKDPLTGEVVAMLGMDIDASSWQSGILVWRFVIAGITLLLCGYFALLLRGIWKTEESSDSLISDHGEVLNHREKAKEFQSFARVSIFKINPREMRILLDDGSDSTLDNRLVSDVDDFVFGILKSNLAQGKEEFSVISNTGGGKNFWRFQIRYDAGMNPVAIKSARINIS